MPDVPGRTGRGLVEGVGGGGGLSTGGVSDMALGGGRGGQCGFRKKVVSRERGVRGLVRGV